MCERKMRTRAFSLLATTSPAGRACSSFLLRGGRGWDRRGGGIMNAVVG
jgi:hypothetical protein